MIKEFRLQERGVDAIIRLSEDLNYITVDGKKRKWCVAKYTRDRKGYYRIRIQKKEFSRSRLSAYAFIGIPPEDMVILHKDSNTINDHYSNLRFAYKNEVWKNNRKNGLHVGLGKSPQDLDKRTGNRIHPAKITAKEAKKIARRLDNGEFASHICKEYNVSEMTMRRIRVRYCKTKQVSPRYSQEVKDTVKALLAKYSPAEVADMTGLSYSLVYRWNKKWYQFNWL